MALDIALLAVGMLLLIKGADFFVGGSSDIARALRVPPLIIGLTLVSIGTSAPEASVSIIGALGGMADMSLGNVIGSNIFNIVFILGLSGTIGTLTFDISILTDMLVMLGSAVLVLIVTRVSKEIPRWQGIVMVLMYAAYLAYIIIRN